MILEPNCVLQWPPRSGAKVLKRGGGFSVTLRFIGSESASRSWDLIGPRCCRTADLGNLVEIQCRARVVRPEIRPNPFRCLPRAADAVRAATPPVAWRAGEAAGVCGRVSTCEHVLLRTLGRTAPSCIQRGRMFRGANTPCRWGRGRPRPWHVRRTRPQLGRASGRQRAAGALRSTSSHRPWGELGVAGPPGVRGRAPQTSSEDFDLQARFIVCMVPLHH